MSSAAAALTPSLTECSQPMADELSSEPVHTASTNLRSFVSSGAAVDCWQSFDLP